MNVDFTFEYDKSTSNTTKSIFRLNKESGEKGFFYLLPKIQRFIDRTDKLNFQVSTVSTLRTYAKKEDIKFTLSLVLYTSKKDEILNFFSSLQEYLEDEPSS